MTGQKKSLNRRPTARRFLRRWARVLRRYFKRSAPPPPRWLRRSAIAARDRKYPEEEYAVELDVELRRRFASAPPGTRLSLDGAGVHWRCTAQRGNSVCSIACFNARGPEYYTTFNRDALEIATARTRSRALTIAAVADWLDGTDVSSIYDRYPFVDHIKRALTRLRDEVLIVSEELKTSTRVELEHELADFYCLRFIAEDRSCDVSFDGSSELPDARFFWDECQLFQHRPDDNAELAAMLRRWLCDHSMPSRMRTEFPWLKMGKLADYYETGIPIEGEFIESWDFIEQFYRQDWCKVSDAVLEMIAEMRRAGYDRLLRAGQSMSSLGLSRSRRHGLRAEQACLWFVFHGGVMNVRADFAGARLNEHPIAFSKDVQRLLDALVEVDVD